MTSPTNKTATSTSKQSMRLSRMSRELKKLPISAWVAAAMLVLIGGVILIVPVLPSYDPNAQDLSAARLGPFTTVKDTFYLLGTDTLGRDLLSRLALAGRLALLISGCAVAISLVIGTALGLIAGFFRGSVERVIMGLADLQLAIPKILLIIAVMAVVGPSIFSLIVLLGVTSWVTYGRVARAVTLSLREREYVLSARTQGAKPFWNIRKHMLPNVMSQMIIIGSFELGQIITLEASLSYLGLGVQAPLPSWGTMIADGQDYLGSTPSLALIPGVAVFLFVGGVQFLTQSITSEGRSEFFRAKGKKVKK